jgi:hypothetical protein
MNAFGSSAPRDMIKRTDFEAVFTEQNKNKGAFIPNSSAIGKKQTNQVNT